MTAKHPFDYTLVRSKRRRTAAIKIEPDGVRVMVPERTQQSWVDQWLTEKRPWIEQKLEQLAQRRSAYQIEVRQGAEIPYLDESLILRWEYGSRNGVRRTDDQLLVTLSKRGTRPVEARVTDLVKDWYQQQAEIYLRERTDFWQARTGLHHRGLIIKGFRRRWGSCDNRGRVSLNWRLICVPAAQADYVIVHELAHLKHFNHSRKFWCLVGAFVLDYSLLRVGLQCRYPILEF